VSAHQLRFISGKYQGGTYQLTDGDEVVMGRGMDAGLTLFEEMVSRHHARFSVEEGSVIVEDLRSKNGTFVNGERIERCELAVGDRILMGTSILRLEELSSDTTQADSGPLAAANEAAALEPEQAERAAALETMVPSADDFDDLDFDESSLTGATATSVAAAIASMAEDGDDEDADEEEEAEHEAAEAEPVEDDESSQVDLETADEEPVLEPDEMVFDDPIDEAADEQLLAESDTKPPEDQALLDDPDDDEVDPFADDLGDPVESELTVPGDTVATGHSGVDETAYRERWGDAPLSVYLAHPMQPSLEFLSPEQLSALQAAHNHGNLSGIAEALRKDDERVKKTVTFLLRSGYLEGT